MACASQQGMEWLVHLMQWGMYVLSLQHFSLRQGVDSDQRTRMSVPFKFVPEEIRHNFRES